MRLTRSASYVVGGRVGMDETHQVNIHFNWDNLSLYPYSLLVYSSLRAECARKRHRFLPCVIFALKTRRFVRGYPEKNWKNVKRKHHFWKFGAPLSHLRAFRLIFLSFRFLPYVSFPLKNWWFSEVLFKSLIVFRKTIDFHIFSLKS